MAPTFTSLSPPPALLPRPGAATWARILTVARCSLPKLCRLPALRRATISASFRQHITGTGGRGRAVGVSGGLEASQRHSCYGRDSPPPAWAPPAWWSEGAAEPPSAARWRQSQRPQKASPCSWEEGLSQIPAPAGTRRGRRPDVRGAALNQQGTSPQTAQCPQLRGHHPLKRQIKEELEQE